MDIQLDHLSSNSGFNQSRFALQFVVVSDTDVFDAQSNVTWQTTTTLDDEHTPGIFRVRDHRHLCIKVARGGAANPGSLDYRLFSHHWVTKTVIFVPGCALNR
jgi:hypothetical protein